jgi:hypothetical protein
MRARPEGSAGVPKWIASLMITYGRAALMRRECDREIAALDSNSELEPHLAAAGLPARFRLWTFLNLWLACLAVVAEGWDNSYKHGFPMTDPEIEGLLASEYRTHLRRFRNKIFHPEPYDHHDVRVVLNNHASVRAWAEELTEEFGRFFHDYLRSN